jgi:hypothetical protein
MECIKDQDFKVMKEKFQKLVHHFETKGFNKFFAVGFCWGVWIGLKFTSEIKNIIAIAGMHPSIGL